MPPATGWATSRSARTAWRGSAAEHQPVFVNLTAAWCITCLVNERTALDSEAVRHAFAERHVVALKGDWTRQDPEIAAFLQQFGRSGVPLYLLYDKAGTPTVLPQILTEASRPRRRRKNLKCRVIGTVARRKPLRPRSLMFHSAVSAQPDANRGARLTRRARLAERA